MPESRPTVHVIGGSVEQRMRLARHIERMPAYEKLYLHSAAIDIGVLSPVPTNPELDEAMHGAGDVPAQRATLYEKLVAPARRKAVTIALPERGIDGKTMRHSAAEKELVAVFGGYTATHGVRASADGTKTPITLYSVTVVDDLGVRDAVGIAGRAAALTGAPVTMTLDDGNVVRVDAEGRFL